jgi:hypothetical protein
MAAAVVVIVATVFVSFPQKQNSPTVAQDNSGKGSLTILTISEGSLLTGATYSITPNPFAGTGTYSIQDGGQDDRNPAAGIIEVSGLRNGNFTVTQSQAPPGYDRDKLSKMVEVKGNSATATFSSTVTGTGTSGPPVKDIIYTAKFECGTIAGNEGPLRPGHYNTDIGVLNKQNFAVRMTWQAVVNDGKGSNAILQTLQPQASTGIVCDDLVRRLGNNNNDRFVEGFVLIDVPVDASLLGVLESNGSTVVGRQTTGVDLLDVQVFYTANALDQLPHEVLVDKIVFTIAADKSGKVPPEMTGKTLDVTIRSDFDRISDPVENVRAKLAEQYKLSAQEAAGLDIKIQSISVGAGTMIDDHALSLSRVPAQTSS